MIRRTLCVVILSFAFVLALSSTAVGQDQACDPFPNQAAAQQALRQDPTDPEGLDGPPGPESHGMNGVACEQLPAPKDLTPVLPGGTGAGGGSLPNTTGADDPPPGGAASQVGGPTGGASSQVSTDAERKLLDAGGNLPLPNKVASYNAPSEATDDLGGPWPWGPAFLILLSSGLLVFSIRGLISNR
jgi:hypothetical protein